jgi:transcriptional regulator of acetoin/glycerol metabolism
MSITKTKPAAAAKSAAPLFEGQSTSPSGSAPEATDFVTDLLDTLSRAGLLADDARAEADRALRGHFKHGTYYVAASAPADRDALARSVLAKFNGRNARQVARELNISRATVYRRLKQPG